MDLTKLSDSEWTVMEALWLCSPQTASEVTKYLKPSTKWAENTVRTLLTRLEKKGALKTGKNASGTKTFIPATDREAYVAAEGDSFMQRVFKGASKPLVLHFIRESRLNPEEAEEIKRLLDKSTN